MNLNILPVLPFGKKYYQKLRSSANFFKIIKCKSIELTNEVAKGMNITLNFKSSYMVKIGNYAIMNDESSMISNKVYCVSILKIQIIKIFWFSVYKLD